MSYETVWEFQTARFLVKLQIDDQFDWCNIYDEDSETQAGLNSGELIAFDSRVIVEFDGAEVGADYLTWSIYEAGHVRDFWTQHRDLNPMDRNCTLMRAVQGENCCICHYFPSMVRIAVGEARSAMRKVQAVYLRAA
jgi:hypothetical protein